MNFLFTDLINSGGRDAEDKIDDPKWMKNFISGFDLESLPSQQDISALKGLRGAIMSIVEASSAGKDPSANDIAVLQKALGGSLFRYELESKDPGNEGNRGGTIKIDGDSVFIADGGSGDTIMIDGDKVTLSKEGDFSAKRRMYSISPEPENKNFSWVLQAVAMSFAEVLASDSLYRVKICGNPDCRWVFFDESKNASRKWCDNACGSLIKMRKFRERKTEKKDNE